MEKEMGIVERAAEFCLRVHGGVRRKNGLPYILHPMETAVIIGTMTDDDEVIAAGLLHDVVEDTECGLEEIRREFGDRVTELVLLETEDKRKGTPKNETWKIRKEESLDILRSSGSRDAYILWMGDKLSNMRSFYNMKLKEGDSMWKRFNESNPDMQAWYYYAVEDVLSDLRDTAAWKEYHLLCELVFGKRKD
ncbi:MAG: bifunctional (p)ppGpp synthetase/guanosine-3',5'-bis(diphosphate) 3'-pyrophosphohydrolase [Eubacterium sp.]|nr:bifunctional (p)ppGpp synthetase/guanosine-3',5'-bis(diphosphate) 3'-pyrophosphohydrolase [Eubacterium sp.]